MNVGESQPSPSTAPGGIPARVRQDMRLGGILVKDGLITEDQLLEVLRRQAEEHRNHPLLGEVLVEMKLVTREQLRGVLERYGKKGRLGEVLVASRLITADQLDFVLDEQKRTGQRIGDVLVKRSFVTEQQMKQALCVALSIPFVDLDNVLIDRSLVGLIPVEDAQSRGIIPVAQIGELLTVAMDDPTDQATIDAVAARTGRAIEVLTSTRAAFRRAFDRVYGDVLEPGVAAERLEFLGGPDIFADPGADVSAGTPLAPELQQAEEVVRQLIALGMRWRTTDIHLEALDNKHFRTRFRIDGVLQELNLGPLEDFIQQNHREFISRIKVLGSLNIAERRRPQDGSFRLRVVEEGRYLKVNCRISLVPSHFGENLVLRILDPRNMPRRVAELGFSKQLRERLLDLAERLAGMLMITGPTGCGKSTTLYALLNTIWRPEIRILTAEEPIEYIFENFSQSEVNERIGNTYASYLRAFLHQDPEVMMIGEIRDPEAAEMAVRTAQTGHLLLSTLHTTDAVGTVARLVDLGVSRSLIGATLLGVLSQRLARTICGVCREDYVPPAELVEEFFGEAPPELRWFHGRGCQRCNFTGYRGRVGIGELWTPSETDAALIAAGAPYEELRLSARQNTLLMAEEAQEKLVTGKTTLEELKRVLPHALLPQFRTVSMERARW
jgi:type IV pilus assembly protein PilB